MLWWFSPYNKKYLKSIGHQFISGAQLCPTICNRMDCSMPGFPVYQDLPELVQTHVYQVRDAIQPSYALSFPSPTAFNLSKHQGLFQSVSSSHQVVKVFGTSVSASVLPMNIHDWFPLGLTNIISLQFKGLSRESTNWMK